MVLPEISLDLQLTRQRKTHGCLNAQEGQKKVYQSFLHLDALHLWSASHGADTMYKYLG